MLEIVRIHHTGFVVDALRMRENINFLETLGLSQRLRVYDKFRKVEIVLMESSNSLIELIRPCDNDSPISAFLSKRGPALHHICFEVDDLDVVIHKCRAQKKILVSPPAPAVAFDNRDVAFVMGNDMVLWEFLENEKN